MIQLTFFRKQCFLFTLLCMFTGAAFAQKSISGKVTDAADGNPLPGVSVTVPGTSTGVTTDATGSFKITVPDAGKTLTFSFIGYQPQTITIGEETSINVKLSTTSKGLNEVVVVGYGVQTRRDVTGTISSIKGSDIKNLPVSDAAQAIQGRVTGVDIVRSDGSPGTAPAIRIRGTGTINNAEPLVIIDGVPAEGISDVSPNDIASMEILKDASSSAIYGTRAANGVIIITTKKGSYGEKLKTSFNIYKGVSNARRYIPLLTAPQLVQLKQERYTNDGDPVNAFWQDPYYATQRTDWQKALIGTGQTTNADVSLRGGNATSNYMISGGYYDEKGLIENTYFKRYSIRINSEHKIGKYVKVGENLQLTYRQQEGFDTKSTQTGLIFSALRFNPAIPERNEDGSYGTAKANNELGDINNPVFTAQTTDGDNRSYRMLASVYGEVQILKNLTLRANYAYDGDILNDYSFVPKVLDQARVRDHAELWKRSQTDGTQLAEVFLTWNKTFNKVHQVTVTGGYSQQQYQGSYFRSERWGYDDESTPQRVLDNGTEIHDASGNFQSANAIASGFARAFYGYKGKYLLTATFRADGSSRFPKDNRWGYFPAFSAGWRISDENFMKSASFISNLKLTGGWGALGNQRVADFQYLALIKKDRRYAFGDNTVTGVWNSALANPDITWEKAEMTNISLEMGFFKNALNATVTYFNKNTKDMLVPAPELDVHGTATIPDRNIGALNNKGWEIEVSYNGSKGAFNYNIAANASLIKNKIVRLYEEGTYIGATNYGRQNQEISRTYVGQPIASFYGWKTNGIYQNQAEIDNDPNIANDPNKANIKPGDVRFLDVDGKHDGMITEADRTYLGNPNPDVVYGIQLGASYKGFDLGINFAGVAGVKLYNADRMQGLDPTYSYNMYAEAMERWHGEGTSNSIPRMTLNDANKNYRTSDRFIESGAYLSLRNATLGYTIPAKVWGHSGVSDVRIYATGQNLFVITKYKGLNPELGYPNNNDGNKQRGVDVATYPQARSFTFGATLNF
jgi:TonB-dependent starch-binding outer membrane protein SusC